MRELKFRVWSEEDKQYRTDCSACKLFNGKTGCPATIYNEEGDRFDIEQYTGLKDKNGKEIYEGDVVHITPYFKKKGGKRFMAQKPYRNPLSVIEWDDDAGAFSENTYENGEFQIGGFLFEMALDSETLEGTQRHTIEVIGNIHENPELLEGEK